MLIYMENYYWGFGGSGGEGRGKSRRRVVGWTAVFDLLLLVQYGGRPECLRETGAAAGGGDGVGDAGCARVGCVMSRVRYFRK